MKGDIVKINREQLRDKIHACWIGKNIGGTIGAPYESTHDMLEVTGFPTKPGEIIPNDDLDLQLAWLLALEQVGPWNISSKALGDFWIEYIVPHYGEYGICKGNMKTGILPGISGVVNNRLKDSNGGWIRTEIWASLLPGYPKLALKYAFKDANVDHGLSEGTYSAMFVSAMQSLAFAKTDIKEIIEEALTYIPDTCRTYKAVKLAIAGYENGTDWKVLREQLLDVEPPETKWFQAAPNVGFAVLGLLYGEGDYKKSVLMAVNCGDDTDCTGATVGATLGIMYGTEGIPKDWRDHVGDNIVTICLDLSSNFFPKTCSELTDRVLNMQQSMFKANRIDVVYTDGDSDFSGYEKYEPWYNCVDMLITNSEYAYDWYDYVVGEARVEFDKIPEIKPNGELNGRVAMISKISACTVYDVKLHLPQGWTAEYPKSFFVDSGYITHPNEANRVRRFDFKITAGENIEGTNKVILEMTIAGRPTVALIPIPIIGK